MGNRRVQLDMSDEGLKDLLKLKDHLQTSTMAEAIRTSIKIVKKLDAEIRKGNKVCIVDSQNKQTELIFV